MTDHDQFFKNLLREFFGDLLRIVVPDLAQRLRVEEPTFLETELFTRFPEGRRRQLDLVARVSSVEGKPEIVLVHVEIEGEARRKMGRRLMNYAMQLWLEHERPVVPIVVYLEGGKPDVTREELGIEVFGQRFFSFWHLAFGLEKSSAAQYLVRPEPLAWGLAALMAPGARTTARHRLACLRPITAAELNDRQRFLLVNCVETYVQLDPTAREEYEALLAEKGNEEVAIMEMTWADRLRQEGFEVGVREGIKEGEEKGKRDLVLHLLERRFGPLPRATVKRVRALTSSEELSRLAARVLDAPSLEDLGL